MFHLPKEDGAGVTPLEEGLMGVVAPVLEYDVFDMLSRCLGMEAELEEFKDCLEESEGLGADGEARLAGRADEESEVVLTLILVLLEGEFADGGTDLVRDDNVRERGTLALLALKGGSRVALSGSSSPSCH